MYIFENDRLGHHFVRLLLKAARRGVKVHVVVDGYGSVGSCNFLFNAFQHPLTEVRVYSPLPWPFTRLYREGQESLIAFPSLFSLYSRLNRRNHTKFIIIDQKYLFLGSRNITEKILTWRESSLLTLNHPAIEETMRFFNWLWQRSHSQQRTPRNRLNPPTNSDGPVCFSHPRRARRTLLKNLIDKTKQAQEHIQIVVPYFFPPLRLLHALCQASVRGVLVEIVLPSKTDVVWFPRMSRSLYQILLRSNVQIFEFQPTLVHAKQIRIDRWVLIGSSNLNSRSLFRDLEIDYRVSEEDEIQKVIRQFELDKQNSKKISSDDIKASIWSRLLSFCIRHIFGGSI